MRAVEHKTAKETTYIESPVVVVAFLVVNEHQLIFAKLKDVTEADIVVGKDHR